MVAHSSHAESRLRVLVVEDRHDNSESLGHQLALCGCHFEICHSGPQALVHANLLHPHVVLLDMELLREECYRVAHSIRMSATTVQPLIVALTDDRGFRPRGECEFAGIDLHLYKPVKDAGLRAVLAEAGWLDRPPDADGNFASN